MKNELAIVSELDHPNIIKIYEFYEDDKRYYVVYECCTGGELYDELCKRVKFKENDASEIIGQLLGAISYCHK